MVGIGCGIMASALAIVFVGPIASNVPSETLPVYPASKAIIPDRIVQWAHCACWDWLPSQGIDPLDHPGHRLQPGEGQWCYCTHRWSISTSFGDSEQSRPEQYPYPYQDWGRDSAWAFWSSIAKELSWYIGSFIVGILAVFSSLWRGILRSTNRCRRRLFRLLTNHEYSTLVLLTEAHQDVGAEWWVDNRRGATHQAFWVSHIDFPWDRDFELDQAPNGWASPPWTRLDMSVIPAKARVTPPLRPALKLPEAEGATSSSASSSAIDSSGFGEQWSSWDESSWQWGESAWADSDGTQGQDAGPPLAQPAPIAHRAVEAVAASWCAANPAPSASSWDASKWESSDGSRIGDQGVDQWQGTELGAAEAQPLMGHRHNQ